MCEGFSGFISGALAVLYVAYMASTQDYPGVCFKKLDTLWCMVPTRSYHGFWRIEFWISFRFSGNPKPQALNPKPLLQLESLLFLRASETSRGLRLGV